MYKRIGRLLFIVIFVLLIGQTGARAAETSNVKDFSNYLTGSDASALQMDIDKIKGEYGLDVVIVITDNTEGKSSMAFADDYYDNNGYGIGSDFSGLLMLVNMQQREIWISTTGKAIKIFNDSRISKMEDNIGPYLTSGSYYTACSTFLSEVRKYAPYGTYLGRAVGLMKGLPVYIIALVLSLIVTIIFSISSKGKVTVGSRTYEEAGTFILSERNDDFIREFTTRTKIESSSGGGGTHVGSSGRSHGGGGRGF